MALRPLTSFMMWNHLAFAHAAHRCVRAGFPAMGALGGVTTLLSLLYHRSRERHYVVPEGLCAKVSIGLLVYHGLQSKMSTANAVLPSALVFALWRLSHRADYERWHPWMHVVVAADVHYFLRARDRVNGPQQPGLHQ
jgi:hypothetical protein